MHPPVPCIATSIHPCIPLYSGYLRPKKQLSLDITSNRVIAPVKSLCESSSSSFGIFLPFFFLLSVCGGSPPTAGLALESICERKNKDSYMYTTPTLCQVNDTFMLIPNNFAMCLLLSTLKINRGSETL